MLSSVTSSHSNTNRPNSRLWTSSHATHPFIPCTSTDSAAPGTVKADPDADHACSEEWAGKDRILTAPAQTTTKLHTKARLFCSSLGQSMIFTDYPFTASPFSHGLIFSNPSPDLWNIKHSASFRMKLISWTPLSSLLISSSNMNSFLQKTTACFQKAS